MSPYRLLIVDDNPNNRFTLKRRLAREGYSLVTEAENGRQAIELLETKSFDLVLLDIMMPDINGYEVLEHIKKDPKRRDIPVIMISAIDEVESVVRCIEIGAEDYLPKPFNVTLLRARVGASLEKKRMRDEITRHVERMERELANARAIQLSMVPTDFPKPEPERPVSVFAVLRPAREIGGDLYDFFWVAPDVICLVVADVSDKGAPAALYMARAKTVIRLVATQLAEANGGAFSPADLVTKANSELCRDNPHVMFVTLFLCLLNVRTGELAWCNAGHNAPYLFNRDGMLTALHTEDIPAGLEPTFAFSSKSGQFSDGGGLFIFSDGITEAMNEQGEFFGSEQLEATIQSRADSAPSDLVAAVLQQLQSFTGAAAQSDDITVLACRWGT
jgi:sigma-B regulation protein RsbU (phosphoserine phosphatase)